MTAALMLTVEIARRLNGDCALVSGGVLANDGAKHTDCSTCFSTCGKSDDMGIVGNGFRLSRTLDALLLHWHCPACGTNVSEATELFMATETAARIDRDPLCHRCRK